MKTLLLNNWYKIMLGTSSLIFSIAFMIFVLKGSTVQAEGLRRKDNINQLQANSHVVAVGKSVYEVYKDNYGVWKTNLITTFR